MINRIKAFVLRKVYKSQYRNGHFYSPIPDVEEVKGRETQVFNKPEIIPGVDLHVSEQLMLLKSFEEQPDIKLNLERTPGNLYFSNNGFFNSADAYFLASMIINNQPNKIIEIGSGFSSALMIDVTRNMSKPVELTFIEPHPERLNGLIEKQKLDINIRKQYVQDVEVELFEELGANDILFIDSSHISKVGSDVNHIIFNILPRLKKGVVIHFHDITYPFEYPKKWIYDGIFWNEAYLLKSFLMYNENFKIILFNSYLYHFHNDWLNINIPEYNIEGGSIWLKKQ